MCKVGIIFDDSLNTATNVPFIDTIANILRDSKDKEEGYLPEEYKNVIIPMLVITRLDLVWADISEDKKARFKKTLDKVNSDPNCTPKMKYDRLKTACGKRFYNESGITLEQLKSADKDNLAKTFKEYIGGFSPNVKTLLKNFKFNDEIDKMKKCRVLSTVINQFWNNRAMFDPKETDDTAISIVDFRNKFGTIKKAFSTFYEATYLSRLQVTVNDLEAIYQRLFSADVLSSKMFDDYKNQIFAEISKVGQEIERDKNSGDATLIAKADKNISNIYSYIRMYVMLLPVILILYFISAILRTNFSHPSIFCISSRNKYGLLPAPESSSPISRMVFRSSDVISNRRSSSKFT